MDIAFAAKLLCDLSLWFGTSGFILSFFGYTSVSFWPAGIITVCGILCYLLKNKKAPLRLLPLLGLFACVFWMRAPVDLLLYIPPCLYCAWLCAKGLFTPDYSGCCSYFRASGIVLALLLLIAVVAGGASRVEKYSLPYFLVFLFCGIAMIRLLRHEEQSRKEWRLWTVSLVSLVLCCAAALFLSSSLFLNAAGAALGALYRYIIQPILLGVAYVFMGVAWLVEQISKLFGPGGKLAGKPQEMNEVMNMEQFETTVGGNETLRRILLAVALVVGIVGFILVAFAVFRRLAAASGKSSDGTDGGTVREPAGVERERRAARPPLLAPRAPREAVRWYYRKFLLKVRAGGIALEPSATTESVARSAEALFDPILLSDFRAIYIAARYGPDTVTADDVKRAREIYGRLKTVPDAQSRQRGA